MRRRDAAFTLIELILVMLVLATVLALAAPSLSGFINQRHLEVEACRLLALTQFARNEAMSRGVPVVLWIDPQLQEFGVQALDGYPALPGRPLQYALQREVRFVIEDRISRTGPLPRVTFWPDGTIDDSELPVVILEEPGGDRFYITRTQNRLAYEALDERGYVQRLETDRLLQRS